MSQDLTIDQLLDAYDRAQAELRQAMVEKRNIMGLAVQVQSLRKQIAELASKGRAQFPVTP